MANEHHTQALALIDAIARQAVATADLDDDLAMAASRIRDAFGHHLVAIWELRGDRVVPRAIARADGVAADRLVDRPRAFGVLGAALADAVVGRGAGRATTGIGADGGPLAVLPGGRTGAGRRHPGRGRAVGRPASRRRDRPGRSRPRDVEVASVVAGTVGAITTAARRGDEVGRQLHRADALRRVAGDIGSRLDLDRILSGLVRPRDGPVRGATAARSSSADPTGGRSPR